MIKFLFETLIISFIRSYQLLLSPFIPNCCRFSPTCSNYALQAIKKHGVKGFIFSIKRLLNCHPFGNKSGPDPVP